LPVHYQGAQGNARAGASFKSEKRQVAEQTPEFDSRGNCTHGVRSFIFVPVDLLHARRERDRTAAGEVQIAVQQAAQVAEEAHEQARQRARDARFRIQVVSAYRFTFRRLP